MKKLINKQTVTIPIYNVILEPIEFNINELDIKSGSFADNLEKFRNDTSEYMISISDSYKFPCY